MLGSFGFSGNAIEKPVEVLSTGEKIRLAFARPLIRPPNFLILDEPTTHLDIKAREALEEALADWPPPTPTLIRLYSADSQRSRLRALHRLPAGTAGSISASCAGAPRRGRRGSRTEERSEVCRIAGDAAYPARSFRASPAFQQPGGESPEQKAPRINSD